MIELKELIESKTSTKLKMKIDKTGGFTDYDDKNMSEDEYREFQEYLKNWLKSIEDRNERERITKLSQKVLDVDSLVTEMITDFLLMDSSTRNSISNMTDDEIKKIRNTLKQKRERGDTCYFYKQYGIKYLGDTERFDKMLKWELDYYNKHHRDNKTQNTL